MKMSIASHAQPRRPEVVKNHKKSAVTGIVLIAGAALALSGCSPQSEAGQEAGAASLDQVSVALVPGGAHPYFQPWKQGGEAAVKDFGIGKVTFNETGEWDQTKQNSAIDSLGAQGYNGFGIFGVSATDIDSTFQDLKQQGFAVGALAACPAGDTNSADFCLSTDTGTAAHTAAKAAIDAMGGSGNLVHLTGNAVDTNTQRRITGVQKAVDETNGRVKLLTTVTDIDKDLQSAQKAVSDLLATRGSEIDGMVTTAGNPAVAATKGVTDAKLPIKVIATDNDPIVLRAVKDGTIAGTVVQNPYGQGYVGTWALANLQAGICEPAEPGFSIDSGSFLVTKKNVETYDEERLAKTKELLTAFQTKLFNCKK